MKTPEEYARETLGAAFKFEKTVEVIAAAIRDEREQCAKVADGDDFDNWGIAKTIAAAIRARGAKP